VVSVKDIFATSTKTFIVLEFVGGGDLFDKVVNEGRKTSRRESKILF
jgi:serine/threonine protein kinase